MPIRVFIDGGVRPPEEAKVSVFDRGFLYGDSVYETIGTAYGRLFAARDHLDRLERSAERIGLAVPPRAEIERAIAETIEAAANPAVYEHANGHCGSWKLVHPPRLGYFGATGCRPGLSSPPNLL